VRDKRSQSDQQSDEEIVERTRMHDLIHQNKVQSIKDKNADTKRVNALLAKYNQEKMKKDKNWQLRVDIQNINTDLDMAKRYNEVKKDGKRVVFDFKVRK